MCIQRKTIALIYAEHIILLGLSVNTKVKIPLALLKKRNSNGFSLCLVPGGNLFDKEQKL